MRVSRAGKSLLLALGLASSLIGTMTTSSAQAPSKFPLTFYTPETGKTTYQKAKVRLLSHNIFWFQGYPFESDAPPAAREDMMDALAQIYLDSKIDILCLQEIQTEDTAKAFAAKLGELGKHHLYIPGGRLPQYGGAIFSRWPLTPLPIAPADYQPERILLGATVKLPSGEDLRVGNLHLPSGRQLGAAAAAVRTNETAMTFGKVDVFVGDFNMTPQAGNRKQGYIDVADTCGAGNLVTQLYGYRGDQVWLSDKLRDKLQGFFFIQREKLQFRKPDSKTTLLSDHWPVGLILD